MTCDRCHKECWGFIGSMFSTEQICFECKDLEKEHPRYAEAAAVELRAVQQGDFNFPGIGTPPDLIASPGS